jgi:hypothetical protein
MGVSTVSEKGERRRWDRVPAEHLVSYTHFDDDGELDDMGMARTLDLSEGGILLEMARPMGEGSWLEIKMVSGEHIVKARGRVAYSQNLAPDRWRIGLCFTEITEGDAVTIAHEVAGSQDNGG